MIDYVVNIGVQIQRRCILGPQHVSGTRLLLMNGEVNVRRSS